MREDGDSLAKEAIYDRFLNNPIAGSDWAGASEILKLDGMAGFKFIAEKTGRELEKSPDDWCDGWMIKSFQYQNPELDVWHELEQAAMFNRFIKIYLDNVKQTQESQKIIAVKR